MADIEVTIGTQDEQLPGRPPVEAERKLLESNKQIKDLVKELELKDEDNETEA